MTSKKSQADWDQHFLGMAEYVSRESNDPSTNAGAIIVRPYFTIAGT